MYIIYCTYNSVHKWNNYEISSSVNPKNHWEVIKTIKVDYFISNNRLWRSHTYIHIIIIYNTGCPILISPGKHLYRYEKHEKTYEHLVYTVTLIFEHYLKQNNFFKIVSNDLSFSFFEKLRGLVYEMMRKKFFEKMQLIGIVKKIV